jgi:thiosulfate/3-mercaptopyruvate sulfurtransferase
MHTRLISVAELQALQASATPVMVFDCSSDLAQPAAADALFAEIRIAGAQQAHLDRDLSTHDAALAVNGGRHPLPQRRLAGPHGRGQRHPGGGL